MKDLRHWRAVEKLSAEQAALLVSAVDPYDVASANGSDAARARTLELAMREATSRAGLYAWEVARDLDRHPANAEHIDIWERTGSYDRYLPSIEMRRSVAAVFKDPENVPILIPVDPWFSETLDGKELMRWLIANSIESSYVFPDRQEVVIQERGQTTWGEWRGERAARNKTLFDSADTMAQWPWGEYETSLLRKMAAAAQRFWVDNYDPTDRTTAPTNVQVSDWLRSQGVADRTADVMASILRVDGLPTGPRR